MQSLDTAVDIPERPSEPEAAYQRFVQANLKRNYAGHYLHGMLGLTGFRLINAPTFIPAYLHALSGSETIVGLGLALHQLGGLASPIVGAVQIEHRKRVLPVAITMGMLMRVQILGLALAGWLLSGTPLLVATLLFLLLLGLFMGAQRVAFNLLLGKAIPIHVRGRLQAWRNLTGGLIAAALSYFAGRYIVGLNLFGNGYGTTFLLAFVLTSLGLTALHVLMREPEPPTVRAPATLGARLREFPALLRADRGFRYFLAVQALAVAGRMAAPFYVLYASSRIGMTGEKLGLLSLAYLGADTLANLVWGYMGDRLGFRAIMVTSLTVWIGAMLLLMGVSGFGAFFAAFVGLGAAQSGYLMSTGTMVLEFGHRDDMAMRLALSSTAENLMGALGPLAGGLIASAFGYTTVFTLSIAFLCAALLLLLRGLDEPRKRQA